MSSLLFVIVIVTLQFLRKLALNQAPYSAWEPKINYANMAAIGLYVGSFLIDVPLLENAISMVVAVGLGYVVWMYRELRPAKMLAWGLIPYGVLLLVNYLLKWITPSLYDQYESALSQIGSLAVVWLFAFYLVANNQKKQALKELQKQQEQEEKIKLTEAQNAELERIVMERTAEIMTQKDELTQALAELQATQAQLIQSEKLASLGELTAGIAHEIQNPLNFVNNFSELSVELIKEIQDERQKTSEEQDEALINELLADLAQNQEKTNHHGKRASSIVKGMLEHSRMSTGVKELTDFNKLADEYLRLSYHGLRAKDKNFQADYKLVIDENLPQINAVPQDMGRVLLNLINNAFYAVNQRAHNSDKTRSLAEVYSPSVTISTQNIDNQIVIKVSDNGTGMPEGVRAKMFQPFFTTKPTGQGTGLGLSLAYDIVTKGHGGTIECDSVTGEGTTFTVKLPYRT